MEITIDRTTLYATMSLAALLVLLALAALGRSFSPVADSGEARLLTWNDWRLAEAQRRFQAEREILRSDMDKLAVLLSRAPDPVAAQLFAERIGRQAASAEAILGPARAAVLQAAQDVARWSAGGLERDTAITSLEAAAALLK